MEALDAEEKRWRERHCDVKVLWDFENINFANNHLPTDDGQAGEYLNNLENWILAHVGGPGQQVELDKRLFCHGRNQLSLLKNVSAHLGTNGWTQVTTGDGKDEADDLMREAIDYFLWENSRRDMGELKYCRAVVLITGDRDFAREIRNIKRYMIGAERGGKQGRPRLIFSDTAFDGFVSLVHASDRERFVEVCDPGGKWRIQTGQIPSPPSQPGELGRPDPSSGASQAMPPAPPGTRRTSPTERPLRGMIYQGTVQEVTRPGGTHKGMLDVIMLPSMRRGRVFGNDKSDGFPEGKTADDFRKGSSVIVWVDSVQTPRPNEERYDLIVLELPGVGDVYQGHVKGTPLVDRMRVSVLPIPGWEGMVYKNPPHCGFPGELAPGDFRDRQPVSVRVKSINEKGCILALEDGPTVCLRSKATTPEQVAEAIAAVAPPNAGPDAVAAAISHMGLHLGLAGGGAGAQAPPQAGPQGGAFQQPAFAAKPPPYLFPQSGGGGGGRDGGPPEKGASPQRWRKPPAEGGANPAGAPQAQKAAGLTQRQGGSPGRQW